MNTVRPPEGSGQEVQAPGLLPGGKAPVMTRAMRERLQLAGQIPGQEAATGVIGNAPDLLTPEVILERTRTIIGSVRDPGEPEGFKNDAKKLAEVYATFTATSEFLDGTSEKINVKDSLLVWSATGPDKSTILAVNRRHLEQQIEKLDTVTSIDPAIQTAVDNLRQGLASIAMLNPDEAGWRNLSALYKDPEAARRFAERSCRDPQNIKTAGKLTLILALGALLILNGIKDFSRGSLSFVTLAALGGLWFLLKKDKQYSFLKSSNFTPIMAKYFTSEAEVRSFCDAYFEMTPKQKKFLTKQMSVRYHDSKPLTEDKLTKPKKNPADESPDAEVDESKVIPQIIASKMMGMSPEDGYVLANCLEGVKQTDQETMTNVLASSRNATVQRELPTALNTTPDAETERAAQDARAGIQSPAKPPVNVVDGPTASPDGSQPV